VPDSQLDEEREAGAEDESKTAAESDVDMDEDGDEDEEPSTQSVSFEGTPALPGLTSTPACGPSNATAAAVPIASTSRALLPPPPEPQHISHLHLTSCPRPSPTRTIDRAAVSRAIAAAMPSAKPVAYSAPSALAEDALVSSFESRSSGSSAGVGLTYRTIPRLRSISRAVVTMGLAGPQILPEDGGDVLPDSASYGYREAPMADADAPPPAQPTGSGSEPAILVNDTPSGSNQSAAQPESSVGSSAPGGPVPASSSMAGLLNGANENVGWTTQGASAQGKPANTPTAIKRERPDHEEGTRKKAKPSVAAPAPAVSPQTLGLIKLVRESAHVSGEDHTKEEIIKFVTDPKGYACEWGGGSTRSSRAESELSRGC